MLLEVHNATKSFSGRNGPVHALADVSLSMDNGEFVAVQGPSGCGKSTLLLAIGGLLAPDGGRILVEGQDPYRLSSGQRARFRAEKIGFVFQQFYLVPYLSVLQNVLAPSLAWSAPDVDHFARELLARFGLEGRSRHLANELSTGEQQRVALARALLNRPRLLLADEPTGNLDRENAELVLAHLGEFADEGGTVLLVTHDDRAAPRAQRILRMRDGKLDPAGATPSPNAGRMETPSVEPPARSGHN